MIVVVISSRVNRGTEFLHKFPSININHLVRGGACIFLVSDVS